VNALPGRATWVVLGTLLVAWLLTILPMPGWAVVLRPQWTALVLIFWVLTLPDRIGVFWSFFVGLMLDVVAGTVLGQHALSFSVMGYLVVELQQRIKLFHFWQQTLSVWLLLTAERLLSLWILGATGQPMPTLTYWLAPVVGMLLWPWLYLLLRDLCQQLDLC